MVYGYHLTLSMYGFWLPNDPRGSWSDYVRSWELYRYGSATQVDMVKSVAYKPHNSKLRMQAKTSLRYPPVQLTGQQARAVIRGFADYIEKSKVIIWACAILRDHIHMVIARHHYPIEQIANLLKGAATRRLINEKVHPFAQRVSSSQRPPSVWGRLQWIVYLNTDEQIRHAIRYVENNPIKEGLKKQQWPFVKQYCGIE